MYFKQLVDSGKTIFTVNDLGKIWSIENPDCRKITKNKENRCLCI